MPDYGKFWKTVFDETKVPEMAGLNKKMRVDWDRWQDEDQDKDLREDFDPDKLIEMMKQNGEWSDGEDDADAQSLAMEEQMAEAQA